MEEHPRRPPIEGRRDRPSVGAAGFAAALTAFHARLCTSDSATETLRRHCAEQGLAHDPVITARRNEGQAKPAAPDQRTRLQLAGGEEPLYRSVCLTCGGIVLCDAEIWYVPSRLPPEVNDALATGDLPFGQLVAPLAPSRRNLASRLIDPEPHEAARAGAGHVIEHRALVLDRYGRPLAEVREKYRRSLFAAPGRPGEA